MRLAMALVVALGLAVPAQAMDWLEATERLQDGRYAGERCGRVMKRYLPEGDRDAYTRAEILYEGARVEMLSVIGRLDMGLVVDEEAEALETLTERLGQAEALQRGLCDAAEAMIPADREGEKGVAEAMVGVVSTLVEAGVEIWKTIREDRREDEQTRIRNIRTALEDAKWTPFEDL